jgi:hypothetical protein
MLTNHKNQTLRNARILVPKSEIVSAVVPRLASEPGFSQQTLIAEGINNQLAIPVGCSSIIIVITLAPLRDLIVGSAAPHNARGGFGRGSRDDSWRRRRGVRVRGANTRSRIRESGRGHFRIGVGRRKRFKRQPTQGGCDGRSRRGCLDVSRDKKGPTADKANGKGGHT